MKRCSAWVAASALALAFGYSPAAGAAGPVFFTVPVDDVFTFNECAFPVEGHTQGAIRVHDFLDSEGNLVREIANFSLRISYTNAITGESVILRSTGPNILEVNSDNSATLKAIGLLARVVSPGQGLLGLQAGRLVLFFTDPADLDPDVLFEAGPHDENAEIDAAICQALG